MARNGRLLAILGLVLSLSIQSQAQTIWADVSLSQGSVYVGEPVSVSVKVYTSTWFTTGLDLGNIKVQGAFSVYFRPVSISFQKDGKTYAGVEQIYHVFPYQIGDLTFPVLDVEVESPAPGDFKGIKHTVKTTEKLIKVKPAPAAFASEEWLVANGLSVTDQWNDDPKQVKVGEVLQRQISRTAYGTVSELIPPIDWDSLPGVSEYPSRSTVSNNKDKTSISATRTETMRYLFEKEGEVTIPEMVFTWYNPNHKKLYKRTLKEVTVMVAPNPDLGVLASVRDSLAQQQAEIIAQPAEDQPRKILGLSPIQFGAVVTLMLLASFLLYRIIKKSLGFYRHKQQEYHKSESYFWDQFVKTYHRGNKQSTLNSLYRWLDELRLPQPTIGSFLKGFGTSKLREAYSRAQLGKGPVKDILFQEQLSEWKATREAYLKGKQDPIDETDWINP